MGRPPHRIMYAVYFPLSHHQALLPKPETLMVGGKMDPETVKRIQDTRDQVLQNPWISAALQNPTINQGACD